MAKAGSRVKITLRCSECKQRNYNTNKNKRNTTERLELTSTAPSAESTLCTPKPSNEPSLKERRVQECLN